MERALQETEPKNWRSSKDLAHGGNVRGDRGKYELKNVWMFEKVDFRCIGLVLEHFCRVVLRNEAGKM